MFACQRTALLTWQHTAASTAIVRYSAHTTAQHAASFTTLTPHSLHCTHSPFLTFHYLQRPATVNAVRRATASALSQRVSSSLWFRSHTAAQHRQRPHTPLSPIHTTLQQQVARFSSNSAAAAQSIDVTAAATVADACSPSVVGAAAAVTTGAGIARDGSLAGVAVPPPSVRSKMRKFAHWLKHGRYPALIKLELSFVVMLSTAFGYALSGVDIFTVQSLLWCAGTCAGTFLCAASASICNQIREVEYDAMMNRTKNRPLVTGTISIPQASSLA